jgi:hypothetical protein
MSASFATFLLAAINLLRAGSTGDCALAWLSFAGCLMQVVLAVSFAFLNGNVFDFRPSIGDRDHRTRPNSIQPPQCDAKAGMSVAAALRH